ncbi:LysR family transcriptional regulator [Pseudorhodoplanes sinuspersici]|uniref:LysR family transcriptional regulator n=1 Tax=Pseudorhodoplanes sinuspersici TaxID=1235591 RepID=A0A1W7A0K6_9HYPH|nr:LysR family transcriptional regulator [Pseudorhodoplanes sinuspersici]
MREVDLRGVDLNLLVVLDALLEEKSVTRAARRLNMSQPAVSRALSRLRALFSDPLLVDSRAGYILNTRAEEIRPALRRTLAGVGDMLLATPFNPAAATGQMRLAMLDLEAASLVPLLLERFANEAPGLDLDILPPSATAIEMLENDVVDAVVGVFDDAPAGIHRRRLFDDGFVTLMRAEHPDAGKKLTLDDYLRLGHIVVSVTGIGPAPVDIALNAIGRRRRVNVRVPSFFAAVEIAARSDLVMTLPSSLAKTTAGMGRLVALAPPIDLGSFTMSLLWHARHQHDPRHIWLRSTIVAAATAMTAAVPGSSPVANAARLDPPGTPV